jgi:hypothetical protein
MMPLTRAQGGAALRHVVRWLLYKEEDVYWKKV